jgi:hypothetical protein
MPQIHLLQAAILLLLVSDVLSYHRFVSAYGRDEVPSGPEVQPHKIAFLLSVYTGHMDRTLALDKPDNLRGPHISVESKSSCERGPASNVPLRSGFLFAAPACEHLSEMPPQLRVKRLPADLGMNTL